MDLRTVVDMEDDDNFHYHRHRPRPRSPLLDLFTPVDKTRQASLQGLLTPTPTPRMRSPRPVTPSSLLLRRAPKRKPSFPSSNQHQQNSLISIRDVLFTITSFLSLRECWAFSQTCRSARKDVSFKSSSAFVRRREIFDWEERLDLLPRFVNLRQILLHDVLTSHVQKQQQHQEENKLRKMQLTHCCRSLSRTMLTKCRGLQTLDLNSCSDLAPDRQLMDDIAHMPNLVCLSVARTDFKPDQVVAMIRDADWQSKLSSLDMTGLGARAFNVRALGEVLSAMRALQSLSLGGVGQFGPESSCRTWFQDWKQESIRQKYRRDGDPNAPATDDELVQTLVTSCPRISQLALTQTPHITDATAALLAEHLPNLTQLSLVDCPKLTDKGLAQTILSKQWPRRSFTRLELLGTTCSRDLAQLIGIVHGRHLQHLSVSCSAEVLESCLLHLTPNLKSLICRRPGPSPGTVWIPTVFAAALDKRFHDRSSGAVWSTLSHLQTLCLWDWELYVDDIRLLCQALPGLRFLYLASCSFINYVKPDWGVDLFRQFPNIEFVWM